MNIKQPTALTNLQRGNVKQENLILPYERTIHELAAQGELYKIEPHGVDTLDSNNMTPLIWAAGYGQEPTVENLLRSGANPNHKAKNGETALMLASSQGFLPIVRVLICFGANLDDVDDLGNSALMYASYQDRSSVIQELLKMGARIATLNIYGQSAYGIALSQRNHSAKASFESHILSMLSSNGSHSNIPRLDLNHNLIRHTSDLCNQPKTN